MSLKHCTNPIPRLTALCLAAALPLVLLAAGCGGNSSTPIAPLSVSSTTADGLTAKIAEASAVISPGGVADYTLTLTNNSTKAVAVDTTGTIADPTPATANVPASLTVRDSAGTLAYPLGATPASPPPPGFGTITVTLQPGQALTNQYSVNSLGTAGTYHATAVFTVAKQQYTVGPLTTTVQ